VHRQRRPAAQGKIARHCIATTAIADFGKGALIPIREGVMDIMLLSVKNTFRNLLDKNEAKCIPSIK
jgi:hypothetical protein